MTSFMISKLLKGMIVRHKFTWKCQFLPTNQFATNHMAIAPYVYVAYFWHVNHHQHPPPPFHPHPPQTHTRTYKPLLCP